MVKRALIGWLMLAGSLFAAQKVVVVVDDSGSMSDWMRQERVKKIDAAKQALTVVMRKLPPDSKVGVLALNGGWLIPLQPIDRGALQQEINRLRARGSTPLGARMTEAADELLKLRSKEIYGDYRMLVVTDGEAGDQDLLNAVLPDIMSRGFLVDVIGVDMQSEHSLATRVHNYRRADDPAALKEAIASSLAESDDQDAVGGETDFEILEPLPADMAPFVLTSLTTANNEPVTGDGFDPGEYATSSGGTFGGNNVPGGGGGGGGGGGAFSFGIFFCMGVLLFLVATVSSLFRSLTRPARSRRRW